MLVTSGSSSANWCKLGGELLRAPFLGLRAELHEKSVLLVSSHPADRTVGQKALFFVQGTLELLSRRGDGGEVHLLVIVTIVSEYKVRTHGFDVI